jgi:glucose/mannose transport system substrate-binding protein
MYVGVRGVVLLGVLTLTLALVLPATGLGKSTASKRSAKKCELQVFTWWTGGGEFAGLQGLIKIWNKNNKKCKFKNEAIAGGGGSNAEAVLAKRLKDHKPPDSFQGHAGAELLNYIKAKQIVPIDFIYKQAGFAKVFPKLFLEQITYKGHIYSVPVNIYRANMLWYNPKVLKSVGVKVPKTWSEFMAALQQIKAAGLIPLALGEQWTQKHLLETIMIGTLGPAGWAKLYTKKGNWNSAKVVTSINRFKTLLEKYTNSDAAKLTWQEDTKLVVNGDAAFQIMGDWVEGYLHGPKPDNLALKSGVDYGWTAVPGTNGVFDWLSDSFTLTRGAPHRAAAIKWLKFLGTKKAQDTFNPLKGSTPANTQANPKKYDTYLKWNINQWKKDTLTASMTHGAIASLPWTTAIDTALGLFLQDHNVANFKAALIKAHKQFAK